MAATLPEFVACVEADVDFSDHKGQVTAYIPAADQLSLLQAAEQCLVTRALRLGAADEACKASNECVYVAVQPLLACIDGLTTTVRPTQELGRVRGVLQLLARPNRVWSYTDAQGHVRSGVVWELDCMHAAGSAAPAAALYQLAPALHTTPAAQTMQAMGPWPR